ncbi:hypothetical protein HK096_001294 [Nowakowskiella sp. JEL0078]|nr:hypothetical protein HK096_001294 [Nowakowskiella sp. JEL0078]
MDASQWLEFFQNMSPHDQAEALSCIAPTRPIPIGQSIPTQLPVPNSNRNIAIQQTFKYPKPEEFKGTMKIHIVESFLFSVTKYVEFYHIHDRAAVDIAAAFLKGPALTWWRLYEEKTTPEIETLDEFCTIIRNRFIPKIAKRQLISKLDDLTQEKSLNSYNIEFRNLLLQLPSLDNQEDNIHRYLQGLKKRTRIEIELRLTEEHTLEEIMQMAELYDSIMFNNDDHDIKKQNLNKPK